MIYDIIFLDENGIILETASLDAEDLVEALMIVQYRLDRRWKLIKAVGIRIIPVF
jgi:hypothetical protein